MNFDFLKQFNITTSQLIKFSLLMLAAMVILVILNMVTNQNSGMNILSLDTDYVGENVSPSMGVAPYPGGDSYNQKLSARNVTTASMPPQYNGYTAGNDAEAFEIKNYSVSIETRTLNEDCNIIRALKARTDVIFENVSEYDRGCNFTFKVEKESVEAVLTLIKNLNPKELGESTYTIKREVEDYTSEIQIYQNKLASLDATLENALASYENITALATRTGDVESLAKIIDSKLALIERLTAARIDTQNQLDYVARTKADALDRLAYTYFTVNVYESTYADGEALKDSWKRAVQQFVNNVNTFAQEMTIGLVMLLLLIAKIALYGTLLLLGIKFGWKFVRKTWQS